MDGDEDGLSSGCELAEEANDVVSRLAIETRGGFVEEEEQLRLGCEFDTCDKMGSE